MLLQCKAELSDRALSQAIKYMQKTAFPLFPLDVRDEKLATVNGLPKCFVWTLMNKTKVGI